MEGGAVCVCMSVCAVGRSVASHIEINSQDYGEKDDGSEDEDQDTVLDDPEAEKTERETGIRQGSQKSYCVDREPLKTHKGVTCLCAN